MNPDEAALLWAGVGTLFILAGTAVTFIFRPKGD